MIKRNKVFKIIMIIVIGINKFVYKFLHKAERDAMRNSQLLKNINLFISCDNQYIEISNLLFILQSNPKTVF